jgi:hypothetical protein
MNKKNNKKITTNNNDNENNENKILSDYFNSMYTDCINFLKDETQCDFIKIKINELNPKPTPNPKKIYNVNNIIYAVAK